MELVTSWLQLYIVIVLTIQLALFCIDRFFFWRHIANRQRKNQYGRMRGKLKRCAQHNDETSGDV